MRNISQLKTKKPKKYNLPKDYLSYSQMSMWQKSKDQYRKRYYENGPSFENRETIFGKQFAKMMEDGVANEMTNKVPRYSKMEHRILVDVKEVPFLGYLDSFDPKTCQIIEYKTGKEKWDNVRLAKHDQVVIYSLLTEIAYSKTEPYVTLVWIETKNGRTSREFDGQTLYDENGQIEFTGKVEVFKRRVAQWERKMMAEKIEKVAQEISEDYTKFLCKTQE